MKNLLSTLYHYIFGFAYKHGFSDGYEDAVRYGDYRMDYKT